ncbi:MAG: hypothetical protein ACRDSG_05855 [Pseudonocardiaceae bacterium]
MDHDKSASMAAALRLTREGRLTEAVAVLKRTLGSPADPPADGQAGAPQAGAPQASPPTAPALSGLLGRLRRALPRDLPGRIVQLSHTEAAGTAASTSTSPPAGPASGARSWSCCTAVPRTLRISRPAPG